MAGQRVPRSLSQVNTLIEHGVSARAAMPGPGPIGTASGATTSTPFAITWWQFQNSGNAVSKPAVVLGVMPQGQLLNAMEITFREESAAAKGRAVMKGFCNYRVRQTVEEHDFQFVNERWSAWTNQAEGTADDPDPLAPSWSPTLPADG